MLFTQSDIKFFFLAFPDYLLFTLLHDFVSHLKQAKGAPRKYVYLKKKKTTCLKSLKPNKNQEVLSLTMSHPYLSWNLPHLFFLTTHSLFSRVEGQGLPWGLGVCRTFRVRLSSPMQFFPIREHGPHSLHSPTSQCTETKDKIVKTRQ